MKGFAIGAATVVGIVLLVWGIHWLVWLSATDADDPSKYRLSGLTPMTDHRTGCQYLETFLGALTPRLDVTGKPICGESNAP